MGLRDKVMHFDTSYSLGFGKPTSTFVFGSTDRASDGLEPVARSGSPIRRPVSGSDM
jgi:hypothetical protein